MLFAKEDIPLCSKFMVSLIFIPQAKIAQYNSDILDQGVQLLLEKWQTKIFPIPKNMEAPFMRNVRVPDLPTHPVPEMFKNVSK